MLKILDTSDIKGKSHFLAAECAIKLLIKQEISTNNNIVVQRIRKPNINWII